MRKMTKKKKLIILSIVLFAISGYMFTNFFMSEYGQTGTSLKVEELGTPDDSKRSLYIAAEARLQKKIMKRRKKGKPADPQVLRELEKLRTVYLKEAPSKDPEVLAALAMDKKGKGKKAAPPAKAPAAKDPKAVPEKSASLIKKDGQKVEVVLPKSVDVQTPVPVAASKPGTDPVKPLPAAPADNIVYSKLKYVGAEDAAWAHSWEFTAPPAFIKENSISIVVYLWHNEKLITESVLYQMPATDGTKEGLRLYFRMNETLRKISPEGNDLMYRIGSNKMGAQLGNTGGNTFIRLKNMPDMKFFVNRTDFKFSSEDDDLFISKTIFQVKNPPPSSTQIIVKFVISSANNPVAH